MAVLDDFQVFERMAMAQIHFRWGFDWLDATAMDAPCAFPAGGMRSFGSGARFCPVGIWSDREGRP